MDQATKFARVLEAAQQKRLAEHEKSCGICREKGPEVCILRQAIVRHMQAQPGKTQ